MESSAIGFRCPGWQPENHPSTDAMSYSRLLPIESISGPGSHHQHEGQMSIASELIKPGQWPYIAPIILLSCSNLFMTLAWYGHLKFKAVSLVIVLLVSWGIAFVEYCFAVPANRIGSAVYSPAELKTIQEVTTLIVFAASPQSISTNRSAGRRARALP